ncbi:MAG: serine/threonine protein kinase [Myxococcales bacterium]|nr:serine/threonine protein kinase [Myxococcales bacterium]
MVQASQPQSDSKHFDNLWKTLDLQAVNASQGQFDQTISAGSDGQFDSRIGSDDLVFVGELGQGGMGIVKLAHQPSLHRKVAVKTLRNQLVKTDIEQLVREARVTGLLEHPNIVPVYSLVETPDNVPLMVMKRVEGSSWRKVVHDPENAGIEIAGDPLRFHLNILKQLASAVHYAHNMGILHRDIKTENVMLGPYQEVYLMDWGCAVALDEAHRGWLPLARESKSLVGTPAFCAPEMLGGEMTERTDVYLLGSTLHEVLTRKARHEGTNLHAVLYSVFKSDPYHYPTHVPRELAEICNKATQRDPEQRFDSAEGFRQAVDDFLVRRGAIELTSMARVELDRLEQLIAAADGESDSEAIYASFGECRFGLKQALRTWPESLEARASLQRAVSLMVRYELHHDQEERAALLLQDLPERNPELEALVEEARARRSTSSARIAALEKLQRDVDISVGRSQRSRLALIIGAVWGLPPIFAYFFERYDIFHTQYLDSTLTAVSFLAIALGVVYSRRDELLGNMASRRLVASVLLATSAIVLLRITAWIVRMPMPQMFQLDMLLCAAMFGLITIAHDFRLVFGTIPWVLGLIGSYLAPEYLYLWEAAGILFSFLVVGLIWRHDERTTAQAAVPLSGATGSDTRRA